MQLNISPSYWPFFIFFIKLKVFFCLLHRALSVLFAVHVINTSKNRTFPWLTFYNLGMVSGFGLLFGILSFLIVIIQSFTVFISDKAQKPRFESFKEIKANWCLVVINRGEGQGLNFIISLNIILLQWFFV